MFLAHTGQNYDYNLNGVSFKDLKLADPDIYMEAVGNDLGETMGSIIAKSYQLMVEVKPDAYVLRTVRLPDDTSFSTRSIGDGGYCVHPGNVVG